MSTNQLTPNIHQTADKQPRGVKPALDVDFAQPLKIYELSRVPADRQVKKLMRLIFRLEKLDLKLVRIEHDDVPNVQYHVINVKNTERLSDIFELDDQASALYDVLGPKTNFLMSATPGHDYFGWNLLYSTVAASITDESDVVIALFHWFLTKNASFLCIGVGDDKTIGSEDIGSELLPTGWNGGIDKYALRYRHQDDVFILLGTKTDDTLVINLLDAKSRNVSNLTVGPKDVVKSRTGPLKTMIPTVNTILDRIQHELLDPVFSGQRKDVDTQTDAERARARSRSPPERRHAEHPLLAYPSTRRDPLRDVGRGDLDPLGRGGGGMIFQPPNLPFPGAPGGLNPLRQPPGARFDPFGPPERNFGRNPNPNPDLFRPPPDYDDMFM